MREFFKGWRRKLGCVTLVMACVFMGGWVRSFCVDDCVIFEDALFCIDSKFGRIEWHPYHFEVSDGRLQWLVIDVRTLRPEYETEEYRDRSREIPYWSVVLPLTLLSAYLLLGKPRVATPTKPVESDRA